MTNDCKEIFSKKEPVSFIDETDEDYQDGKCIEDKFYILGDKNLFVEYYCSEEQIIAYFYYDENCKKSYA